MEAIKIAEDVSKDERSRWSGELFGVERMPEVERVQRDAQELYGSFPMGRKGARVVAKLIDYLQSRKWCPS